MTRSERILWRRWVERRDGDAFAALVRRHARFVYDFARRVAGNAADAEDLAQEAYLKLAEAAPHEPDDVGLRAFLGRRVVLGARMLKRAALARRHHEARASLPPPAPGAAEVARREQTQQALALLPAGERRAVELRFLHDLPYAEIGVVLGVSEEAARMRVHRGLERIKARLGRGAASCLAALPLFDPPAAMLASTARTALLTGGAVVAQATGKKIVVVLVLVVLAGIVGTLSVRGISPNAEGQATRRTTQDRGVTTPVADAPERNDPHAAPPRAQRPRIRGVVVDTAGEPIPDATLRLLCYGAGYQWREQASAADGTFAFEVDPERRNGVLEARHPAYATSSQTVDAADDLRVVLESGILVRIEVRADGAPVGDARVAATTQSATSFVLPGFRAEGEGTTDDGGTATFHVAPGRYQVWVSADGWAPKLTAPIMCIAGESPTVRVDLDRGGFVEGAVRDSRGAPVAGARVVVQASPGCRRGTTTEADGTYVVEHVPLVRGPWLVAVADHPDHAATSATRMWMEADGNRMRFDLVFPKTSRLFGVALDADGTPLPHQRVFVRYPRAYFHVLYGRSWSEPDWPFATTTDRQGRFDVEGLPPGDARLSLGPPWRDWVAVELEPGGARGPVELRVAPVALRGRVLSAEGEPVPNARITPSFAKTDADGRFELHARPKEVVVAAEGYAPVTRAVKGAKVEIRFSSEAIGGAVVDPAGKPIPDVIVTISSDAASTQARTDDKGRFRFLGAERSVYRLDVRHPGHELIAGRRTVLGPQRDIVLVLATPGDAEARRVRGVVVDDAGKPIGGHVRFRHIDAQGRAPQWRFAAQREDRRGWFVCERLEPAGDMTLVFDAPGYLQSDPVRLHYDGRGLVEPLRVELRRGAELEVLVREEDGTPRPGAFVSTYSTRTISGRTDADGRCLLSGIPPGRCKVQASHEHLTEATEAEVTVAVGTRQTIELRGKAAACVVVRLPEGTKAEQSLVFRVRDVSGAVVRENRVEKARLRLMDAQFQDRPQWSCGVIASGTYHVECEVDGVALSEAEVGVALRQTVNVDLTAGR